MKLINETKIYNAIFYICVLRLIAHNATKENLMKSMGTSEEEIHVFFASIWSEIIAQKLRYVPSKTKTNRYNTRINL